MSLVPPTFLFRFAVPCRRSEQATLAAAAALDETFRIPSFSSLEGRTPFADVRLAWHSRGLLLAVTVTGKRQPVWCRATRIEDSDGVQLWIDTRDTHHVHRASRFCHRFAVLPAGAGGKFDQPSVSLLAINRARESPKPIEDGACTVRCRLTADGYQLAALLPAAALTGYDPAEQPKLGFYFAVIDRELGWQTLTLGPDLPVTEDPSLWGTLELI